MLAPKRTLVLGLLPLASLNPYFVSLRPPTDNSANDRTIVTLEKAKENHVGFFRIFCGVHCFGFELGPGSLYPLGTLSSQCPWRIIQYWLRYPSIKKIPDPELMLCKSIDFVIPEDRLRIGTKTLTQFKSLTPCPEPGVCPSSSQGRHTSPPAFHIHIEDSEVPWPSIHNQRLSGSCHRSTALSCPRRNSSFRRNSSLRPTKLLSHPGGRVGDRVSSSRTVIQLSSPSLISCWKPFCVCTHVIQGSA